MKRWVSIVMVTGALAMAGCKKDKKADDTAPSGSAAASGSAMAGSGTGTMAGSGTGTMAGSGSGAMAGSGSAAEAPRPASITDEMLAKADAFMELIVNLGGEFAAAGTDCKKATAAAKAATPAITAAVKDVEKIRETIEKDEAAEEWMEKRFDEKMEATGDPFLTVGKACKDDKDFAAAMKELKLFEKKASTEPPAMQGDPKAPVPAPAK